MKFNDITNKKFGRLTALFLTFRDKHKQAHWMCGCECGNTKEVNLRALTSGATRSCGCLNDEVRRSSMIGNTKAETHRLSDHYLYDTWSTMKQRCINPNHAKYEHYGARGITVCSEWIDSFEKFLADMGDRPEGCTLSRIDNDGPFCKDNCEWQTHSEQNRNRRKYKRNKHVQDNQT